MLTQHVQTISDLMSIALFAEREAIRRYRRLAQAMHSYGNLQAAALFERMVREEQQHERLIEEWAELENIELHSNIGPIKWETPQTSTHYDSDAVEPEHSTPYRALAFAVHNEERAFSFYTQVAATADSETVREYAETLAHEELGHAARLRAMRRQAWRAERDENRDEPVIDPAAIHTQADLMAVASSAEQCLEKNLANLVNCRPELEQDVLPLGKILQASKKLLTTTSGYGEAAASAIASIENYADKTAAIRNNPDELLQRLRTDSDRCFAFYDSVVAHTNNEAIMTTAQKLSELALQRISFLREFGMNDQAVS